MFPVTNLQSPALQISFGFGKVENSNASPAKNRSSRQ